MVWKVGPLNPRVLTTVFLMSFALSQPLDGASPRLALDGRPVDATDTAGVDWWLRSHKPRGPSPAVGVDAHIAVVGIGSVARVIDIADPAEPVQLADLVLDSSVTASAVYGDHALLADSSGGLHVIDLEDPTAPVEVGSMSLPGPCDDLALGAGVALATIERNGVVVIDLDVPEHPVQLAHLLPGDPVSQAVVEGSLAFLATTAYSQTGTSGALVVFDIGAPSSPVQVGSLATALAASAVAVRGSYAYLTQWESGLLVLDISDATSPEEVASLSRWMRATDIAIAGDSACVSEGNQGLVVIDISDPLSPAEITTVPSGDWSFQVDVAGSIVLLAGGAAGVQVIDLEGPGGPVTVSSLDAYPWIDLVEVIGNLAYVHSRDSIRIYSIGPLGNLDEIGSIDLTGLTVFGSAVTEDRLFLVASATGSSYDESLLVYDVTDPANSSLAGRYEGLHEVTAGPTVVGGHVILAELFYQDEDAFSRQRVIDVADPASPHEIGRLEYEGTTRDLDASEDYVLASMYDETDTSWEGRILVVDLSIPEAPITIGSFVTNPWIARELAIDDRNAAVIDGANLHILALDDPTMPIEIGSLESVSWTAVFGLRVDGHRAWIADIAGKVHEIDLRDPAHPSYTGFLEFPDTVDSFDASGGLVFTTAVGSGIHVFGRCRMAAARRSGDRVRP